MKGRALLRSFGWLVLCAALLGLALGYLGLLHPAGDSLAVFRLPFAGLAMIAAFCLRRDWRAALAGAVASLVVLVGWLGILPDPLPDALGHKLRVYQKNMLYRNTGNAALIASIRQSGADLVMLEEVSAANLPILETLQADYPLQAYCPFRVVGGVAVLARQGVILDQLPCQADLGMAGLRIGTPQGPLWVIALHLPWPWPHEQSDHVQRVVGQLRGLDGEMVLAGDFNTVGWANALSQIEAAGHMERVGAYVSTFDLPPLGYGIGIDHILATGGTGVLMRQPKFSSDHYGLLADILLPPSG